MTTTSNTEKTFPPDVLTQKLLDADCGGFQAECTPEEAEAMGAFPEDALELDEALEGSIEAADAV